MKYFDDIEKLRDFIDMNKDDFLSFYSYLEYEDYDFYKEKLDYFKNNYNLKLLKVHKDTNADFSMLLLEELTQKQFWIDCVENEDGYYSWDFNQYIFHLYCIEDIENKLLQDIFLSEDVLEGFDYLIDCFIYEAVEIGGIKNENYN
jgi:hypothetical protein